MQLKELESFIPTLFATRSNPLFLEESGVTARGTENITHIGYCTNLTLKTIEDAHAKGVDLLLTHHDAWTFVFGLKEACTKKLIEYGMAHYFIHLPLDDCDFGTNQALGDKLGLSILEKTHEEDGFYCGRIGEFDKDMPFSDLKRLLEGILGEPVRAWNFGRENVRRVGLVSGAGGYSPEVKKAVDKNCDVYITGESNLYTLEYAQFAKINLIIGSHTFTEVFGVENLARKIKDSFPELELVPISEAHLETNMEKR